jgi:hypothetical protein
MPFFAPVDSIVEAMEYDGTSICADRIVHWANLFLLNPGFSISFVNNQLSVVINDSLGLVTHNVNKGNYVVFKQGSVTVLSSELFKQLYERTPDFNT